MGKGGRERGDDAAAMGTINAGREALGRWRYAITVLLLRPCHRTQTVWFFFSFFG